MYEKRAILERKAGLEYICQSDGSLFCEKLFFANDLHAPLLFRERGDNPILKSHSDRKVGGEIGTGRFRRSGLLVDLGRPRRRAKRKKNISTFFYSPPLRLSTSFFLVFLRIFLTFRFLCYNNGSRSRNWRQTCDLKKTRIYIVSGCACFFSSSNKNSIFTTESTPLRRQEA